MSNRRRNVRSVPADQHSSFASEQMHTKFDSAENHAPQTIIKQHYAYSSYEERCDTPPLHSHDGSDNRHPPPPRTRQSSEEYKMVKVMHDRSACHAMKGQRPESPCSTCEGGEEEYIKDGERVYHREYNKPALSEGRAQAPRIADRRETPDENAQTGHPGYAMGR